MNRIRITGLLSTMVSLSLEISLTLIAQDFYVVAGPVCATSDDWTITRRELRKQSDVRGHTAASRRHRLILVAAEGGDIARGKMGLLCGVENVNGSGHPLLNPFTRYSFPRSIALVVYDVNGQFVLSYPPENTTRPSADDLFGTQLRQGEMRGRFVHVQRRTEAASNCDSEISLDPGEYQLQLVACDRFFMGDPPKADRIDDDKGPFAVREAARSEILRINVSSNPCELPADETPKLDEPKLLARLEIKEWQTNVPQMAAISCYVLTLNNISNTRMVGVIDPFSSRSIAAGHPVRWIYKENGVLSFDTSEPGTGNEWPKQRSDFVLIPPQGIAACRVGAAPTQPGEYAKSVDLVRGIVTDDQKLAVLQFGDPEIGWTLRGVDKNVIHQDSILAVKVLLK